jgi:hypothetical protein
MALVTRSRRSLLRRWALQGIATVVFLVWVMYVASSLTRAVGVHVAPGGGAMGPLTFLARYAEYAVAGFNSETTWLTVTATVALTIPTLARYYETLADPAEDYRPLIAQMRPLARPTDAALTAYIWQDGYLASYAPDLRLTFYRNVYKAKTAPRLLEGILRARPAVGSQLSG